METFDSKGRLDELCFKRLQERVQQTFFFDGYLNLVLFVYYDIFQRKQDLFIGGTQVMIKVLGPLPTIKNCLKFCMKLVSLRKQSFNSTVVFPLNFSKNALQNIHFFHPKHLLNVRFKISFLSIHLHSVWTLLTRVCFQTFTEAFLPLKTKLVIMFVGTFL